MWRSSSPGAQIANMAEDRRYSDREFALILRRAAELQESVQEESASGGLTLGEIKGIGAAAGIDPELIAQVAGALPAEEEPREWWRAVPTRFHFSENVDGELPKAAVGDIIEITRQETGVEGQVSQVLETIEWRAGSTRLSLTPAEGRTRIRVIVDADYAENATIGFGSVSGILGTMMVGSLLSIETLPGIITLAAGGMVTTYGLLQLTRRTLARRAEERGRQLIERILQAAGAAIKKSSSSSNPAQQPPTTAVQ
jgi:hypothetical protein